MKEKTQEELVYLDMTLKMPFKWAYRRTYG